MFNKKFIQNIYKCKIINTGLFVFLFTVKN